MNNIAVSVLGPVGSGKSTIIEIIYNALKERGLTVTISDSVDIHPAEITPELRIQSLKDMDSLITLYESQTKRMPQYDNID